MRLTCLAMLSLLAACGQAQTSQEQAAASKQIEGRAGPEIRGTPVAGVAMACRYELRLPIDRVARVQEQHAAACEALGSSRCRISGMFYEAQQDRTLAATLDVRLAPDIARRFGSRSVADAVQAGGMLTSAEMESEEVGLTVAATEREQASIAGEREDLTRRLRRSDLSTAERAQLQRRQAELLDTRRLSAAQREAGLARLASTPMRFSYASGDVDAAFSDGPMLTALKDGWGNGVRGLAVLVMLLISAVPWVLGLAAVVALVWLLRVVNRWFARRYGTSDT